MNWYRTYRPTTVAGLHLQSVRETLQSMLKSGNFPHALLFAGPKGTGKTSAARIIGAVLNDPQNADVVLKKSAGAGKSLAEPDPTSEIVQRIQRGASYVVTEMDAASNRGIDDIRRLREQIFLPPQEGLVNVYILDEAHMLTTEAFNALLKILEEPPAHVVFILATTELHKIPDTIISRCVLVQFHKATDEELLDALGKILVKEKITFAPEALLQVVKTADGSFRDGVKLLEMVAAGQSELTLAHVMSALHSTGADQAQQLVEYILQKDEQKVVQFFEKLRSEDTDQTSFHKNLLTFLHQDLLTALGVQAGEAKFSPRVSQYLLTQFNAVKLEATTNIPFLSLELKALELIFKSKEQSGNASGGGAAKPKPTSAAQTPQSQTIKSAPLQNVQPVDIEIPAEIETEAAEPNPISLASLEPALTNLARGQDLLEKWEEFLLRVRQKNSSIEALLRSSKPISADGEKAQIEVYYQFHREQLQQPKFRSMLDQCMNEVLGAQVLLEFTLAAQSQIGAKLSTVSGQVNEEEHLIKLAKEILV